MPKYSDSDVRDAIQLTAKRLRDHKKMNRKQSEDFARKSFVEQERIKRDKGK